MMKTSSNEISIVLRQADDQHPRQDMASILPFDDGRLLCAYGECYAGIEGDDGATWSEPFLIPETIGRICSIEPSLLRLPSGRVLRSFMRVDRSHLEPAG